MCDVSERVESIIWTNSISGMTVAFDADVDLFRISFPALVTFTATFPGPAIQTQLADLDLPPETFNHLLQDQVLPRLIAHDGNLVLHGGGVSIDDRAIAIMAPTGHGKSTLSASLQTAGHRLLGDDALIVEGDGTAPTIRAVYPSLRLLPDSIAHIFGAEAETREMAHYSAKRHVTVDATEAAAPLGALIFLTPPEPEISLRPMSVAQTCMSLIANSFALDPTDSTWATANMRRASALAAKVPAFALAYPRDYAVLPAVHAVIRKALDALNAATP